ncbi:MAG: hypothetical protein HQL95_03600 [Magnetococcales bacterium]|nr:hypothetical protein [Magnetococcales bacterium]
MKHGFVVPLLLTGLVLAPLQEVRADAGQGAAAGMVTGALIGSLSGPAKNRLENSLIGAVAGGLLGYSVGNEREKQGRGVVYRSLEYSPSYQTTTWVNPESRVSYVVTPRPVTQVQGRSCREVEIQGVIDSRRDTMTGLACRDETGQWRLTDRVSVVAAPPQTVVVTRPATRYVVEEYPPPVYYPAPVVVYRDWGRPYYYGHRYYDRPWRYRY